MKKKLKSNYPWVFWFNISIRTNWFSYMWKTRGANFLEIQFLIFKISIGRPWIKDYVLASIRDYNSDKELHATNVNNVIHRWFGWPIGSYVKFTNGNR